MNAKQVFGAFFGMVFKVVLWIIIIVIVYKCAIYGYSFGYQVFSDAPIDATAAGVTVSVAIVEGKTNMEIGELLEEKGLIKDAKVFYVQVMLSDYKDAIKPGIYELSTTMTTEEMIKVMAADSDEEEGQESDS